MFLRIMNNSIELIDNINKTLRDNFAAELHSGSKIAIAASCFSIYAFEELKTQLKDIEDGLSLPLQHSLRKNSINRKENFTYHALTERETYTVLSLK